MIIEIKNSPEEGWDEIESDFLPNIGNTVISPSRVNYSVKEVIFDDDENKGAGCTVMLLLSRKLNVRNTAETTLEPIQILV